MSDLPKLRHWSKTDVGKVRDHNEDSVLADEHINLFVVADGMGGHAAGEIASSIAVQTVRDAIVRERDALLEFERGKSGTSRKDILRLLESSVQQACSAVHAEGIKDEGKRGMGTTVDALLVIGSRGFIAHVGDSRVYLYRQGLVHQLTEDHSLVNELIRRGKMTRQEIEKMQYKNAVTRAVGVYESVEVDVFDFDVLVGDRILLTTDGMHGYVEADELPKILRSMEEEKLVEHLVDLALERGGHDNISVIMISVPEMKKGTDHRTREVHLKLDMLQRMPLFRFLGYQELVRIVGTTEVWSYRKGQDVFREGEEGDALFIVLEGAVEVFSKDDLIAEFGPGQHFGEMALVDKSPRSASVRSRAESKLLVIKRSDFFEVIRKEHDIAVKLLWSFVGVLAQRLRSTSRELQYSKELLAAEDLSNELVTTHTDVDELNLEMPEFSSPSEISDNK